MSRPVRLALLRHGLVEGPGEDPPLSPAGIAAMEASARGMARMGLRFASIHASPMARAVMTARIVAEVAGEDGIAPAVTDLLAPGAGLSDAGRLPLSACSLLVGHAPDLGRIAAALVGAKAPFSMGRGDLCVLSLSRWPPVPAESPGSLECLVPAGLLAALGAAEPGR